MLKFSLKFFVRGSELNSEGLTATEI